MLWLGLKHQPTITHHSHVPVLENRSVHSHRRLQVLHVFVAHFLARKRPQLVGQEFYPVAVQVLLAPFSRTRIERPWAWVEWGDLCPMAFVGPMVLFGAEAAGEAPPS